jgi:enterochelin esterase-like enzyme
MWSLTLALAAATRMPSYMTDVDRCKSETAPITMPCSLPARFSRERLQSLLAGRKSIWWIAGDRLTLVARYGHDPWGMLCCAIQASLEPIGETGLGVVTVRVPRLQEALLDIGYDSEISSEPAGSFRGPEAPAPPPRAQPLRGRLVGAEIDSKALGEKRSLSIYLPPETAGSRPLPVLYLADGDTEDFAPIAEAAVAAGRAAPAIIVGIHPGYGPAPGCTHIPCDRRMLDYMIDLSAADPTGDTPFGRHLRYVTDEVIPYVERTFPASRRREDRILAGYSNGASWALAAAEVRPNLFVKVLAMSGGTAGVLQRASRLGGASIFAGAGLFEPDFHSRLTQITDEARNAGGNVEMRTMVSGHSRLMWDILFEQGIEWLLPAKGPAPLAADNGRAKDLQ